MEYSYHETDEAALVPLVFGKSHLSLVFDIEDEGVTAFPLPLAHLILPKRIAKRITGTCLHILPRHFIAFKGVFGRPLGRLGVGIRWNLA